MENGGRGGKVNENENGKEEVVAVAVASTTKAERDKEWCATIAASKDTRFSNVASPSPVMG